jgi:lysozyme
LTIGVGRNIENIGISHDEAMYLLGNDIDRCVRELSHYDWFICLDDVRQGVLIELNFNIGLSRLLGFKKMIAALNSKDYVMAGAELLDSRWAIQVGKNRSNDMANRMISGEYND